MSAPHPLAAKDEIVIGGTGSSYDTTWIVASVPSGDQAYSFTLTSRGSNYPSHIGDVGGLVGLTYSRFKDRAPEFNHHRNQLASGSLGVGIPRYRNKRSVTIDFGTSTWDQVSRVARYERDRALGPDVVPYVTPVTATAELDLFAQDAAASGNQAIGLDPGDRVSVDDLVSVPFAGEYEVLEVTTSKDSVQDGRAQAGRVTLKLGPYLPAAMYDTTDGTSPGWTNVPGSGPGNNDNTTTIPLQDGTAEFYSGIAASGATMPIPQGYNASTFMGWAAAAGYVEANHQLHCLRDCDFDGASRILSCVYSDGNDPASNLWTGDNSYAGLVTRTLHSLNVIQVGSVTYRELTLQGGERVAFGSGLVSGLGDLNINGAQPAHTVQLPDGYALAQSICLAFVRDGIEVGDNDAHGFSAWVDRTGKVHSLYQDGEGHRWIANNVRLFVYAWLNNNGTVTRDANGWWGCPAGGKRIAWCGFDIPDPNGAIPANHPATPLQQLSTAQVPLPIGMSGKTFQAISGPLCFDIVDHPTHGIRSCYVNGDLQSLCSFEDGEGHIWHATAGVFGLVCE